MSNSENNSTFNTIFWLVLIGGAIFWIRVYLRSSNSSVNNPQQSVNRSFILDSTSAPDQYGEDNTSIISGENDLNGENEKSISSDNGRHYCSMCHGNGYLIGCNLCGDKGVKHCFSCGGRQYDNSGRVCISCNGSGVKYCPTCNGNPNTVQEDCYLCKGRKYTKYITKVCDWCDGDGIGPEYDIINGRSKDEGPCSDCNGTGKVEKEVPY